MTGDDARLPPSGADGDGDRDPRDERARRERAEQEVRDERARRQHAEQALEHERQRTEVWRARAEERAERIRTLRRPRARLRAWRSRGTSPSGPAETALAPTSSPEAVPAAAPHALRRDRTLPSVRVLHVTAPGSPLGALMAEFDAADLREPGGGPADADLFVVDARERDRLPAEAQARLEALLAEPGRAPLVTFVDAGHAVAGAAAPGTDRVVDLATWRADDGSAFLPWFDRAATTVRLPAPAVAAEEPASEGALAVVRDPADGSPVAAWIDAAADPGSDPAAVALMAAGVPVLPRPSDRPHLPDPWALAQASVAQRRAAHTAASSGVRARDLTTLAGVAVPEPVRGVAAVLISNRPDQVLAATDRVLAQRVDGLELHVGLHGGGPPDLHAEVARRADAAGVIAAVTDLPADRTLGWCYNAVIERCAAPFVAKIDDDDHYGPHHLQDALQALDYAGADIVGKASYLAYVVDDDATYLVNAGKEERDAGSQSLIGGSLVLRRAAWERSPFPDRPSRVDSLLLRAARAQGLTIYATSRFEFVYERRGDGHTWGASAQRFRARAERVAGGLDEARYRAG